MSLITELDRFLKVMNEDNESPVMKIELSKRLYDRLRYDVAQLIRSEESDHSYDRGFHFMGTLIVRSETR